MECRSVLELLSTHKSDFRRRFHVRDLAVFGSTARGESCADSDLDVLVTFDGPATFDGYTGLKEELERMFGSRVDLAIESDLHPGLRQRIAQEALHVA